MTWRSTKMLALAQEAPYCMSCGMTNDGTLLCACHSNELAHGRGMGHKAADWAVAYCCADCHSRMDGRSGTLSKEEKRQIWRRAFIKTMGWLFESGRIRL